MISVPIEKSQMDILRRTAIEMNIEWIEGSETKDQIRTVFLLCSGEQAWFLAQMFMLAKVESRSKNIYRERI